MVAKTYLVSLVSEQTLPNYLFIKEFQRQVDKFIFITTDKMESLHKTEAIYQTARIDEAQLDKILVDENSIYLIQEQLGRLNLSPQSKYMVNLTGGTKLMSIAVYEYFKHFPNARFFYVPIGKNTYKEIFDDQPSQEKTFTYKLSLKEYLEIYGIRYEKSTFAFNENETFSIYDQYVKNTIKLTDLFQHRFESLTIRSLDQQQQASKWFEEFLFYLIKKQLNLDYVQIDKSILLFDKNNEKTQSYYTNDNEIDIAFIYNNNIYIVEAKLSLGTKKINSEKLYNALFKLAAVNKRFGLRAKAILMTLSDLYTNHSRKQSLTKRCKILNMPLPIDGSSFINLKTFKHKLQEFVK